MTREFTVFVDDNFHYQDRSRRYELGKFNDFATAVSASQRVVDDYLERAMAPGMSANALYQSYTMFAQDPFITGGDETTPFSAWDYAKRRCQEICKQRPAPEL